MYELCALLRQPKARKPRKASAPKLSAGKVVRVLGQVGVIVDRDTRYANAWVVEFPGGASLLSYSRDMIEVVA